MVAMYALGLIAVILACFVLLGKVADVLIAHIRRIGERLGLGIFFLGLLLGLFTSFPELALGINSYARGASALSLGNLLGGIPVLLALVLGLSAVLNRKIRTDRINGSLPFMLVYLMLPLALGADGIIGMIDGIVLVLFYLLLTYAMYAWHRNEHGSFFHFTPRRTVLSDVFLTVVSAGAILLLSTLIVQFTLQLLAIFRINPFFVGLLIFAIGTNLPELTIAVRSWRQGASDLSLSHLLGSALCNVLLVGIFSFMRPLPLTGGMEYAVLFVMFFLLLGTVYLFARSDGVLSRREGISLIACYAIFLLTQGLMAGLVG